MNKIWWFVAAGITGAFWGLTKIAKPMNLSYRDVITYLTQNKPDKPIGLRGIALREAAVGKDCYKLTLAFIDPENNLIQNEKGTLGIVYRRVHLEQELLDAFGTEDMIIFE